MSKTKSKNTIVSATCVHCGRTLSFLVPIDGYEAWKDGLTIQDSLPELSEDLRELLTSRTCSVCWDELFGDDE